MNHSEGRAIVKREAGRMLYALGLNQWKLDVLYERIEGGSLAACNTDLFYKRILIRIDLDLHNSEWELLRSLRHEMFHVFHAYFNFMLDQSKEVMTDEQARMINKTWKLACENMVQMLEFAFDAGLGISPQRMLSMSRRRDPANKTAKRRRKKA